MSRLWSGSPGCTAGPNAAAFDPAGLAVQRQPALHFFGLMAVARIAVLGQQRLHVFAEVGGVLGECGGDGQNQRDGDEPMPVHSIHSRARRVICRAASRTD